MFADIIFFCFRKINILFFERNKPIIKILLTDTSNHKIVDRQVIKVFSNGGRRGGVPPPTENLLILQPGNIAPVEFPQPKFNSPLPHTLKNNFYVITQYELHF